MKREQALELVNLFDGQAPVEGYESYCEYFGITIKEFLETIDKFANKDLFEKIDEKWVPRFKIE
jgi:hypothetical protein